MLGGNIKQAHFFHPALQLADFSLCVGGVKWWSEVELVSVSIPAANLLPDLRQVTD